MAAVEGWWWLSPGVVCFIFLNVIVGAIAVMSRWQRRPSLQLGRTTTRRSSSAVLDRLRTSIFSFRSIDYNTALYLQSIPDGSQEPEQLEASRVVTEQSMSPCAPAPPSSATSIQEEEESSISLEEAYALARQGPLSPAALTAARTRWPGKAEARHGPEEGNDEVNARADDFIRKFRDQLKLQRLNSIFNYTQMLKRRGK